MTFGDIVAVDGKAVRRSFEDAANHSPLHLVQAFATEARLTLRQVEGAASPIPVRIESSHHIAVSLPGSTRG